MSLIHQINHRGSRRTRLNQIEILRGAGGILPTDGSTSGRDHYAARFGELTPHDSGSKLRGLGNRIEPEVRMEHQVARKGYIQA